MSEYSESRTGTNGGLPPKPMTDQLRQEAEALYDQIAINTSGGSDWREVAMGRIITAFRVWRWYRPFVCRAPDYTTQDISEDPCICDSVSSV